MRALILGLTCSLICSFVLCAPALAHGGQPTVPGDASPPGSGDGGTVAPPTNPSGGFAPGPGANSGSAGTPTSRTRDGRPRRGVDQRSSQKTVSGISELGKDFSQWDLWWGANRDRFLDLRARLGSRTTQSGSPGHLTQRGRRHSADSNTRPSAMRVENEVAPALLKLLASSDEPDIVDSTVLALARMTDADESSNADAIVTALVGRLSDKDLSVRSAAALALGVLGDSAASDVLAHLAADDSDGRALCGGGAVGWLERSFAALGLGLSGQPGPVKSLADLAQRLPDSETDVKVCTVIALGLVDGAGAELARTTLRELLGERKLDPMIKSYVPTALANLGDRGALPLLSEHFADRDTNVLVLQSLAIALGRLADIGDEGWDLLGSYVEHGRDVQTRHFALIALAEIAARDAGATPELQLAFVRRLHDELDGDGKSRQHRPWAALAAAIWGRVGEHDESDLVEHLRNEYEDERDPLVRSAFAIGLGLLRDRQSGTTLMTDFQERRDPVFRAHTAVALGLLGFEPAADVLRSTLRGRSLPPHSRVEIALGLGLMGDPSSVPDLIEGLGSAETLGLVAGHARALGLIGDGRAVEPLLGVIEDDGRPPLTRGFGCVALGMLCEKQALPFNARIKMNNNYRAQVPSVAEVLDIL